MLESIEQSNIKRMNLETPKERSEFIDVEKDITEKDWEEIENYLNELKKSFDTDVDSVTNDENKGQSIIAAGALRILKPDSYMLVDKYQDMLSFLRKKEDDAEDWNDVAYSYQILKEMGLEVSPGPKFWDNFQILLNKAEKVKDWSDLAFLFTSVKSFGISYKFPSEALALLESETKQSLKNKDYENYIFISYMVGKLNLGINFQYPDEVKSYMKDYLEKMKLEKKWIEFLAMASVLHELDKSSKVQIQEDEALPHQRNF